MLYPRIRSRVYPGLISASLLCLLLSCGGGKGGFLDLISPAGNAPSSTGPVAQANPNERLNIVLEEAEPGAMRQQVDYSYDYSGFPQDKGVSVVAMATESEPDFAARENYSIALHPDGTGVRAELRASGQEQVYAHLRFDPARWETGGVFSKNVWGTEHFLAAAVLAEPGLLVLSSQPVGENKETAADAVFAEVELLPVNSTKNTSYTAPSGQTQARVIWLRQDSNNYYGMVNFRMDGLPGDYAGKDDELNSAERSTAIYDNLVQDVELDTYGTTLVEGADWTPKTLNWSEFFRGDNDNNGEVNLSDLTPIGN